MEAVCNMHVPLYSELELLGTKTRVEGRGSTPEVTLDPGRLSEIARKARLMICFSAVNDRGGGAEVSQD